MLVAFIIDEEGQTTDIKIKKSLSPECDTEVMRLIRDMPTWTPAQKDGKAVSMEMVLPIAFALPADERSDATAAKLEVTNFKAFPNPAADVLNVQFSAPVGTTTVQITDIQGRVVMEYAEIPVSGPEDLQFDVSKLLAGTYFVVIRQEEKIFSEEIQIQ